MTRRQAIGVIAGSLAAHGLLLAGLAAALPGPLRLAAAFAVLVLVPGWAFVVLGARAARRRVARGRLGVRPRGGLERRSRAVRARGRAALPRASSLDAAHERAALGARASGAPAERRPRGRAGSLARPLLAVLLAAAFAAVHAARFGPPLGYLSDTPDHVGTLRRMLQSGDLFPADAFFRDAGRAGADPRKGLWHGIVALLAQLASARSARGLALAQRPGRAVPRAQRGRPGLPVPRLHRRGARGLGADADLRGWPGAEPGPPGGLRHARRGPVGARSLGRGACGPGPARLVHAPGRGGAGLRGGDGARLLGHPVRAGASRARARAAAARPPFRPRGCAGSPGRPCCLAWSACPTCCSGRSRPTRRRT